jgi:hypothetical protein
MIAVAVFAFGAAGYVWRRNAVEREQALWLQVLLRAHTHSSARSEALAFLLATQRPSPPVAPIPPACW